MNDVADDPKAAWQKWHERRVASVSAPYGPLALTGTFWLADHPEGRIPAVPGHWRPTGDGVALTASAEDGLGLDGEPSRARRSWPRTAARPRTPGSPPPPTCGSP